VNVKFVGSIHFTLRSSGCSSGWNFNICLFCNCSQKICSALGSLHQLLDQQLFQNYFSTEKTGRLKRVSVLSNLIVNRYEKWIRRFISHAKALSLTTFSQQFIYTMRKFFFEYSLLQTGHTRVFCKNNKEKVRLDKYDNHKVQFIRNVLIQFVRSSL